MNVAALFINVMGTLQAKLNYTLNSLTIGLKSAQPIAIATTTATAIILSKTQTPTSMTS
jgi:hypothetical protein